MLRGADLSQTKPIFIAIDYDQEARKWCVFRHADERLWDGGASIASNIQYSPLRSELQFAKKGEGTTVFFSRTGCLLESFLLLLQREMPPAHVHGPRCKSLFEFVFGEDGAILDGILEADDFTMVLASHLRCDAITRQSLQMRVQPNQWAVFGAFGKGSKHTVAPDGSRKLSRDFRAQVLSGRAACISITPDLDVLRLNEEASMKVSNYSSKSRFASAEKFPEPADKIGQPLPPLDPQPGQSDEEPMDLSDKRFAGLQRKEAVKEKIEDNSCDCRACVTCTSLEFNLPETGRQKLFK